MIREYDPVAITSKEQEEVERRLNWKYEHQASTATLSKQSVTELKRQYQYIDDEYNGSKLTGDFPPPRPAVHGSCKKKR